MSTNKHTGIHLLQEGHFLADTDNVIKHQRVPGSLMPPGTGQPLQMSCTAPPVDRLWNHRDRYFTSCLRTNPGQLTTRGFIYFLHGLPSRRVQLERHLFWSWLRNYQALPFKFVPVNTATTIIPHHSHFLIHHSVTKPPPHKENQRLASSGPHRLL